MSDYNECFDILVRLTIDADEDCPFDFRSDNFIQSLQDAKDFINKGDRRDPLNFWEL